MNFFSRWARSSRGLMLVASIAMAISLATFVWLGIDEIHSVKELRHIVTADFAEIEKNIGELAEVKKAHRVLRTEIDSHLRKKIHSSYRILSGILVAVIFSGIAWVLAFLYVRRQKNIKSAEYRLEELLYYDQVSEMHETLDLSEYLPPAIKEMQLNRDTFTVELERALRKHQFILHYQPIINAESGEVVDVEALVRWKHPEHGLLLPGVFLPLCETNGFIIPLGEWILKTALQQLKKWHAAGFNRLTLSVNFSPNQLNHPGLFSMIREALVMADISPAMLKLEVTENALIKNVSASQTLLTSLSQSGLHLSLDDFGTGYSSLSYLKQFPVSHLKIDKSFIHDITTSITSLAIVESVIALSQSLGLTVTAEGVENQNQLHLLNRMKCDLLQGYLFSRPIEAEAMTQLLASSRMVNGTIPRDLLYDTKDYQYEIMQEEHADQAVDVITHAFCEFEPMTRYLGIRKNDFVPFARLMVDKAIQDGLSIVALDWGKVRACTIVEDMAAPLDVRIDIDPGFRIIFSFLEKLGSDFFKERQVHRGHIAHLFITAVDKNYHGQGLSRKINFESIRVAREKGFDFMCCKFTHDYNQKGTVRHLKSRRLLIRSCDYMDFVFEGKKPFANLAGTASAYIWELREGAQLRYQINVSPEAVAMLE